MIRILGFTLMLAGIAAGSAAAGASAQIFYDATSIMDRCR